MGRPEAPLHAYEEHVLRVLESSKIVAAACGLLNSGWGVSDRILKKVTELSHRQRASAAKDVELLNRRYGDLAALLNSIEEAATEVAGRLHRISTQLREKWAAEIFYASGGLFTLTLSRIASASPGAGEDGHPGEASSQAERGSDRPPTLLRLDLAA